MKSDLGRKPYQSCTDRAKELAMLASVNAGDKVYTIQSLADELNMSYWAIQKRIKRGQIPAHYKDGRWHILKSEFINDIRNA